MRRTIEFESEFHYNLAKTLRDDSINAAVGYLTGWAADSFDKVYLNFDAKNLEIGALYTNTQSGRQYYIQGIYSNGQWSFHS